MIKYLHRTIRDKKMNKLSKAKKGSWLFAYDISHDDLKTLVDLGFDKMILEDALDFFEVPRFEYEDGINYLFTRYPVDSENGELSTAPLLVAISDKYILTVSHKKPEFLDGFSHNRAKLITTQKIKSLLIILDVIIGDYDRSLMKIRRTLMKYFGKIESVSEKDLKHIVVIESKLVDYMSALTPTKNAISTMLMRKKTLTLHGDDIEIMEDLTQDVNQIIDSANGVSKTAQNVRSTHEIILGHKLNSTMKTLTAITIILTVPMIITGLFGMNVWLPFRNGPEAFLAVIGITIFIAVLVARWFSKNNWF